MKKWMLGLVIALVALVGWRRYGYLFQSVDNLPRPSTPLTEPKVVTPQAESDPTLAKIKLHEGYAISYFAKDVPGARSMTQGANGIVYVGTRQPGVVYALEDLDQNGVAEARYVVADKLDNPNGVAYKDGDLYVAQVSKIIKFANIDASYKNGPSYSVVYDQLPSDKAHGWKYLAFGPDDKLYIPIGMPCNICSDKDRYGRIIRIDPSQVNGGFETVAMGVRNSVGFDWDPRDNSLWFTDNGRDWLGDDTPDDELNHVTVEGSHYGFPYCHAGTTLDPVWGRGKLCQDYVPPVAKLGAHVAALGMKFLDGKIVIAEHGSWNRPDPVGYRVVQVDPEVGEQVVLAEGWMGQDGKATGRPVDILVLGDKSILVSDDLSGEIYRLVPTQTQ